MFMTQAQIGSQIWGIAPLLTGSLLVTEQLSPVPFVYCVPKILPSLTSSSPQPHFLFVTLKQCRTPIRTQRGAVKFWSILSFWNHTKVSAGITEGFTHFDFWKSDFEKADHLWQSWSKEAERSGHSSSLYSEPLPGRPFPPNNPPTLYCLLMGGSCHSRAITKGWLLVCLPLHRNHWAILH